MIDNSTKLDLTTDAPLAGMQCCALPFDSVIHGDFLNNNLPDKCAQLIIADPPYFEVKGVFDFVWNSFEDYLKDVEKWAVECKRILADNGTLFWYGHAKNIAYAQVIFDMHFNLINNLVWDKGSFMGLEESEGLRSFAPCTERILMYGNKTETYHTELGLQNNDLNNYTEIRNWIKSEREKIPHSLIYLNKHIFGYDNGKDGVAGNKLSPFKANWQFPDEVNYNKIKEWCFKNNYDAFQKPYEKLRKEYEELRKEYEELRRPFVNHFKLQEIFRFSNEAVKTGAKYDHDTVKPETLTRALIMTCSRKNDLVIVPFAGSGTEVAMSVKEGRRAIGYDIEKKYVDMSNKRIKTFKDAPTLF
jgi:site-specific DNA-methyltransferase (adenine-specific)